MLKYLIIAILCVKGLVASSAVEPRQMSGDIRDEIAVKQYTLEKEVPMESIETILKSGEEIKDVASFKKFVKSILSKVDAKEVDLYDIDGYAYGYEEDGKLKTFAALRAVSICNATTGGLGLMQFISESRENPISKDLILPRDDEVGDSPDLFNYITTLNEDKRDDVWWQTLYDIMQIIEIYHQGLDDD